MSEYGPADVVIEPDGTTFVRLESPGIGAVLVNMDKLREYMAPPVGGYRFADSALSGLGYAGWRLEYMAGQAVHVPPAGSFIFPGGAV
ncbi:hypothetical protein VG1_CDS0066 [Arthrobacter phage Cupello]|nr:hypothetical protein VG1_CDS0066 [Arthrobacter phage Cupello]